MGGKDTKQGFQLELMSSEEVSSLPHDCTWNCRGASCCDTTVPGMMPPAEQGGFTGTLVTDSHPEIAGLSPSSVQREVPFLRAACNPVCP